jgi:simple sugar transport system permease protein
MTNRAMAVLTMMGTRASFVRLIAIAAAIVVTFSILRPAVFLSASNLQFLALATPELAILSLAIALTMLTAGIDLSVVAIANVAGVTSALMLTGKADSPGLVLAASASGILAATVCGLINGVFVAYLRVTPILATLGTSQLFAGVALVLTQGTVIKGLPESFTSVATVTVAGIPVIFLLMIVVAVVLGVVLTRTSLGFRMRMLGANEIAAKFSGFKNTRILLVTYAISGLLAGIAGLVISSRASGANSDYGTSYILLGIVVAVLAGVNPDGGYMTVAGVVIATLTLQLLSTGLLGLNISAHIVNIAQGSLLIGMMALNFYGGSLAHHTRRLWRVAIRPREVRA